MSIRALIILLVTLLLLAGCSTLGYYAQSITGHLDLMSRERPISEVLADSSTDDRLRKRLQRVQKIRRFASETLKLPDNDSYLGYADLERKAVVWSVVATPEFSMEPVTWCYPVVGCAAYRGYFSRAEAEGFAQQLSDKGLDVTVEAVPAYSTLGWFDDPLPSTVIEWPEPQIAGLIFHELAHQQLYVQGDSAFNEGFASTVEQIGVERWLALEEGREKLKSWQVSRARQKAFVSLLLASRKRLVNLYGGGGSNGEKREAKAHEFERLRREYGQLKRQWQGAAGYDRWFARELNNARLASVATYENRVPAFLEILAREGGDMGRFYSACSELGGLPEVQRHQQMDDLIAD